MELIINKNKCPQNHKCPAIAVCPKGAISQMNHIALPVIDKEKCIVCGKCIQFCPMGAFEKRKKNPQEANEQQSQVLQN